MNSKIYIIGAGGVGSWLAPALCRMVEDPRDVILVDGDKLEEKNLDRQLFDASEMGENKAYALADKYGCDCKEEWFSMGQFFLNEKDWLLVCVDNHPARFSAIQECNSNGCKAVFAANETWSAEAYVYQRQWRGTALDPLVYYPDIARDHSGDPRGAAAGCTGEAQRTNRQLVNANMSAAALAAHLFALWHIKLPTMGHEARNHLPFKIIQNMTRTEVFKVRDHYETPIPNQHAQT